MAYRPLNFIFLLQNQNISTFESQNPVTLIITITTFCQCGNNNHMVHILSTYCSTRPIRTPLKSVSHASKYCIYVRYFYLGDHFIAFTEVRVFYHEKDAQNVVTRVKLFIICSKCQTSSETLHNKLKMS